MTEQRNRLVIFLDWPNVEGSFRELGGQPDVIALREYLTAGRDLIEAVVYAGTHPSRVDQCRNFHSFLRREGFLVKTKQGKLTADGRSHCDLDVQMALDIVDFARNVGPDIVVLASGDGDFVPVVRRLREVGIRVEVAATVGTISDELREIASGFIDLEQALLEGNQEENTEKGGTEDGDRDDEERGQRATD